MVTASTTQRAGATTTGVAPWPADELERVTHCPVCGSGARNTLYDGLTDRTFFCAPGTWTLYSCSGCGSAYLDPRPRPASIGRAYAEYFTHADNDQTSADRLPRARWLRRALANGYLNWRFGTHLEPTNALGVPLAFSFAFPGARESLDASLRYLPKPRAGARLLDIGAGNGDFLAMARTAGWTVQGVEPDPKAAAVCRDRGLDVYHGGIEKLDGQRACFDYITISHVIEHVHNPRSMLQSAFHLLKPGGCLYVDTPNIDARLHKRYGAFWRGLEPPRHLVLFNWRSLERMLRDVGAVRILNKPYTAMYPSLKAQSRALMEGRDCQKEKATTVERIVGRILAAWVFFHHNNTEFVTLLAYKPDGHL